MPPDPAKFDPGLSSDRCIYAETVAGDGGVHEPSIVWWLSPDVLLNDAGLSLPSGTTTPGTARVGDNAIGVRVRKKLDCSVVAPTGQVQVDLFVAVPTPGFNPTNSMKIGDDTTAVAGLNPSGRIVQFGNWTPGTDPKKADGPGHKCMVGRVYPEHLSPDGTNFHIPDDPHVVQRNICIQPCDEHDTVPGEGGDVGLLGPDEEGFWVFDLELFNPDREIEEIVTLTAWADVEPARHVLAAATTGLKRFRVEPADYPPARLDLVAEGGEGDEPAPGQFVLKVPLRPLEPVRLGLRVDFGKFVPGQAHFVHVAQTSDERPNTGGCTVVFALMPKGKASS
jgi:hypothetical protein